MSGHEQASLLLLSIRSAFLAGDVILHHYYKGKNISVALKRDFSPITIADREAHEIICGELAGTGFPLLSEEGTHFDYASRNKWNTFWLVDPLDGTKEFLKRNDEFTVNIALIRDNLPLLGVVYAPALDRLYYAGSLSGSYSVKASDIKELKPDSMDVIISISEKLPLKISHRNYTVVTSRSHLNLETRKQIKILQREHGDVAIISSGSSLKFCLVAEGSADIYPRFGPTMEWDTAAGQAVAVFSGCSVNRYDTGEVLTYNKEKLLNPWFIVERVKTG
jgi:3'(2'), 5'-bisphosphate nucleotidase